MNFEKHRRSIAALDQKLWSILFLAGTDPEGGFGDLSPLNFLEVKIIKNA